jgi:GntR family transcriptional repressor for pyruvate dehydrogenase complex
MTAAGNNYTIDNLKGRGTVERIVANIITLIREGNLLEGDKLPAERQLCEMIGISRPILRQALKALQVMNIIDIRQGAGAYIRNLEPKDIVEHLDIVFHLDSSLYHDLYEARRILEPGFAGIAVEHITEAEIIAIEENIRAAEICIDDEKAFLEKDLELHEMIIKASGNRVLPVFMQSINKLTLLARHKSNANVNIRRNTINDHQMILTALKNRDSAGAVKAMADHIANVEKRFLAELNEKG